MKIIIIMVMRLILLEQQYLLIWYFLRIFLFFSNSKKKYFFTKNPDEFKSFVRKGLKKKPNMDNARMAILPRATAPASIDWRNINGKSYVQAVKNQGSCGSCWSFASVAAIESYAALANGGTVPNLSEQNLVDCTYRSDGCDGGNNDDAWNYLIQKQAGAIATSSNYPYVSGTTQTVNLIFYLIFY
jgi:C1A family cysteine protease